MSQQAVFALVTTSLIMSGVIMARLWIQRQRGTLQPERELRNILVVAGWLIAAGVLLFSRAGALLGLPTGLLLLGVTLVWLSRRQPERQPGSMSGSTLRMMAILAIVSGAGGVVIGLVRLATGT